MVWLGIIFSLFPLAIMLLEIIFFDTLFNSGLLIVWWLLFCVSYVPYFIFYIKRRKEYQNRRQIKAFLDKFLILEMLLSLLLSLSSTILLPILEIICLKKIRKLEDLEQEWVSFKSREVGRIDHMTEVSSNAMMRRREAYDRYQKSIEEQKIANTLLFVTYLPLMVISLFVLNIENIPSGLVIFIPVLFLYIILLPIYGIYLNKRMTFYQNSPRIKTVLKTCLILSIVSFVLFLPLMFILHAVIESYAYIKVKRMVKAGYYHG